MFITISMNNSDVHHTGIPSCPRPPMFPEVTTSESLPLPSFTHINNPIPFVVWFSSFSCLQKLNSISRGRHWLCSGSTFVLRINSSGTTVPTLICLVITLQICISDSSCNSYVLGTSNLCLERNTSNSSNSPFSKIKLALPVMSMLINGIPEPVTRRTRVTFLSFLAA